MCNYGPVIIVYNYTTISVFSRQWQKVFWKDPNGGDVLSWTFDQNQDKINNTVVQTLPFIRTHPQLSLCNYGPLIIVYNYTTVSVFSGQWQKDLLEGSQWGRSNYGPVIILPYPFFSSMIKGSFGRIPMAIDQNQKPLLSFMGRLFENDPRRLMFNRYWYFN